MAAPHFARSFALDSRTVECGTEGSFAEFTEERATGVARRRIRGED